MLARRGYSESEDREGGPDLGILRADGRELENPRPSPWQGDDRRQRGGQTTSIRHALRVEQRLDDEAVVHGDEERRDLTRRQNSHARLPFDRAFRTSAIDSSTSSHHLLKRVRRLSAHRSSSSSRWCLSSSSSSFASARSSRCSMEGSFGMAPSLRRRQDSVMGVSMTPEMTWGRIIGHRTWPPSLLPSAGSLLTSGSES